VAGKASKIIADDLGVSPRTVDVHRFRLMHTLGAQSLPDLFRLVAIARGQVEQTDAPITPASSPKGAESE
jgi:DNA-binding NarL/FixJ family response regulator